MDVYKFASTLIGYALDGCDSDGGYCSGEQVREVDARCGGEWDGCWRDVAVHDPGG